ncbi:hypothetical protein NDU88_006374 [Pleurodeles waltl]|uniref:Secreted protein n=1 Tax=Pleurodeles waltl TaxID=8319 RepID=A0AAV7SPF3_PLEWA|nr:hypothetical protein NDU88_006374 [Pleurodeles waltl]
MVCSFKDGFADGARLVLDHGCAAALGGTLLLLLLRLGSPAAGARLLRGWGLRWPLLLLLLDSGRRVLVRLGQRRRELLVVLKLRRRELLNLRRRELLVVLKLHRGELLVVLKLHRGELLVVLKLLVVLQLHQELLLVVLQLALDLLLVLELLLQLLLLGGRRWWQQRRVPLVAQAAVLVAQVVQPPLQLVDALPLRVDQALLVLHDGRQLLQVEHGPHRVLQQALHPRPEFSLSGLGMRGAGDGAG